MAWSDQPLLTRDVAFTVAVYQRGGWRLDTDNMMKPVQDALTGVVWKDDRQVVDSRPVFMELDGEYYVAGISMVLASGFNTNQPFLYAKVCELPLRRSLP